MKVRAKQLTSKATRSKTSREQMEIEVSATNLVPLAAKSQKQQNQGLVINYFWKEIFKLSTDETLQLNFKYPEKIRAY